MRTCAKCRCADCAEVDNESICKCGAVDAGHENHHPECPRLIHNVAQYYVRVSPKELMPDKSLSPYYVAKGWQLISDGGRQYRWIMMCRQCIRDQEDVLAREKDHKKCWKSAKGQSDQTYSQMLARQSH